MTLPTSVSDDVGFFDRFATSVANMVSRAPFFAGCVLLVLIWAPSYFLLHDLDTWQLIINTLTTIITFLLVALFENSQRRSDLAIQHKLNAIAGGLADLMESMTSEHDVAELKAAVGLEERETSA
jgi:low affinity Fe/Cu permease